MDQNGSRLGSTSLPIRQVLPLEFLTVSRPCQVVGCDLHDSHNRKKVLVYLLVC